MKTVLFILLFAAAAFGQDGIVVSTTEEPSPVTWVTKVFYNGGKAEYVCKARGTQPVFPYRRTGTSPTIVSVAVSSHVATVTFSAAHGLSVKNRVDVAGATTDTDLNASYVIASVPSDSTLTFSTSSVANGTYTDSTLVITTQAPRLTAPIWKVQYFANGASGVDSSSWGENGAWVACADRATLAY